MKKEIISYRLYNWRYIIAHLAVIGLFAGLVGLMFWYAPAGLRQAEIDQVASLNFKTLFSGQNIIDFPYKLLQLAGLKFFGLSTLTVKLPSLIFGGLSLLGFFWLIAHWINRKTALIASAIVMSTSQLMIMVQDGTPGIMFIFWQIVIMILLTKVSQFLPDIQQLKANKNKATLALILPALGVVLGLSVYTPMVLFLPLLLVGLSLGHPKPRLLIKQFNLRLLLPGIIGFILIISPLLLQIITQPSIIKLLINLQPTPTNIFQPLIDVVNFWSARPEFLTQPIFGLGALVLAIIGAFTLGQQYFSVRSMAIFYLTLINLIICLSLSHNPSIVLWLPLAMMIAYGIHSITLSWMTIFPLNPYPRVFGSLVISLTMVILSLTGIDILLKNYAYTPNLASQFRQDLHLLDQQLRTDKPTDLLVADQAELDFYKHLKKNNLQVKIFDNHADYSRAIFTKKAFQNTTSLTASAIINDSHSQDSDRFYLYQKNQN